MLLILPMNRALSRILPSLTQRVQHGTLRASRASSIAKAQAEAMRVVTIPVLGSSKNYAYLWASMNLLLDYRPAAW